MEQPNIPLYLNLFAYIFRPHSCHTEFRLKHGFIGGIVRDMKELILSSTEEEFLNEYDIPISKVFDAKNFKSSVWKKIMLENEFWIAIGVTPCKLKGHTMRTSGGHCAQCSPDSLRFLKRYYAHGYVYLAGSLKERVIKIGFSNNVEEREETLNEQGYGNIYDWKVFYYLKTNNSGKLEFEIHKSLHSYLSPRTFIKNNVENVCREIFACNSNKVKNIIEELIISQNIKLTDEWIDSNLFPNYNFN